MRAVHEVADAVRAAVARAALDDDAARRVHPPAVFNARDLSRVLGVTMHSAHALIESGRLRVMEHAGDRFVLRDDLIALFESSICGDCLAPVNESAATRLPTWGIWRCRSCEARITPKES